MTAKRVKSCLSLLLLSFTLIASCDPVEPHCKLFSASNGDFEARRWKVDETGILCRQLGFEGGTVRETFETDSVEYVEIVTCCGGE